MKIRRRYYLIGVISIVVFAVIIGVLLMPRSKKVPESVMQQIYAEVKTPFKYGLVLPPFDNSRKIDSPSIFRIGGYWYMSYVVFDGYGYETWIAQSDNLLQWTTIGMALWSTKDTWDANQKAGYIALVDNTWGGNYEPEKFDEKYWMSYLGGATQGNKAGKLGVGMAFSDSLLPSGGWRRLDHPVLLPEDPDARQYEKQGLLKSTVIFDKDRTLGYPFVMFYNARGGENSAKNQETEQLAMAVSDDMVHWKRYGDKPFLSHISGVSGDACIARIHDVWVMFYFGAFWKPGTFTRFACSYDLVNWTDWEGDNLIEPSEPFDRNFIHNSCVIKHDGVVYHFYSAVNDKGQRGILLATSVDIGKSSLQFPSK